MPNKMRIYVGTYAKYNNGSIDGRWLNLGDYADADKFYDACKELHKDEEDPEFMFQDWEGIPDMLADEFMDVANIYEYRDKLSKVTYPEAFEVWVNHYGDDDVSDFNDAYQGEWDNERDFADYMADELGYYKVMEDAGLSTHYFDVDAFARDLFINDYVYLNGYVFNRSLSV